ncbi:MAG: response regulator [Planctomycetes bacterium]|nr:response regulator [Planctomycetota bacterium]
MSSILIVEDNPDIRLLLKIFLVDRGHFPILFENAQHAELSLDTIRPDLALLDINLPGGEHGISFGWRLRKAWPDLPIIIMSAELSRWDKADIYDSGADEIVDKPFDMDRMGRMIARLLSGGRPEREAGVR